MKMLLFRYEMLLKAIHLRIDLIGKIKINVKINHLKVPM